MEILSILLQITIYSGVIFFVTMLIKRAFKAKISPFLHFAIWAVFLLRLIVPVTLEAPLHFFTYPANANVPITSTYVISDISTINHHDTLTEESNKAVNQADNKSDALATANNKPVQTIATRSPLLSTEKIVLIVWLGGAALGILYISLLSVSLWRKIARRTAPTSARLQSLLCCVKEEMHIKTHLRLLCQYEYCSPALLFPRTILMPIDNLITMNDEQIKNCLRHECMHYKRGDHLMSLLLTVLNAVYWFNPFMWLAYYEIRKDMETACDGAVVRYLPLRARRDYAELILKLSDQSRHFQLALGMAHGLKNAERRIKGVFMAQKTKRSVKLISLVLAAVLTFCCFTTACQPTPEKPVVVNKAEGITSDMIAESSPSQLKEFEAPEHWKETISPQNGHVEIEADVDVIIPENLSDVPVVTLEQIPLTQERLAELTQYFIGNTKLYKPLPMTKFEGKILLKKMEKGEGYYSKYDKNDRENMANKLEELIKQAPDTAEKEYTDLSYVMPYESEYDRVKNAYLAAYSASLGDILGDISAPQKESYVEVFAETGEEFEPKISASTYDSASTIPSDFSFAYPGSFLSVSDIENSKELNNTYYSKNYTKNETMNSYVALQNQYLADLDGIIGNIKDSQEQALEAAQKVLDSLDAADLKLSKIEKGVWVPRQPQEWDELSADISKAQGGYCLSFARSIGQLVGYREGYGGATAGNLPQYTPPFRMEAIDIFICNGKILKFKWKSMAQTVETVAENTNLLPFDEIKSRLIDYLSFNSAIPDAGTIHFDIVSAQLRASQIPAKDDPERVWMVPSWTFLFKTTLTYKDGTIITESAYPCEINALDGGIIIPNNIVSSVSD